MLKPSKETASKYLILAAVCVAVCIAFVLIWGLRRQGGTTDTIDVSAGDETPSPVVTNAVNMRYVLINPLYSVTGNYTGEWSNNMPNGTGEFVVMIAGESACGSFYWELGDIEKGTFVNGLLNGFGEYIGMSGFHFEGNYVDGLRSGHGRAVYFDGSVYEGEWKANLVNGHGKYIFADGDVYEGEWSGNLMHGHGRMIYADGGSYEGEYRDNVMHGRGKYTFADGTTVEGMFAYDTFHGNAVFTYPNGDIYNAVFDLGEIVSMQQR
jgi:hypothetical protein